ncbi:hypothetical protein [Streptomyces sampsonii]|nr:hypothetical protein [Streptomyces sampsonii]
MGEFAGHGSQPAAAQEQLCGAPSLPGVAHGPDGCGGGQRCGAEAEC